MTRRSEPIFNVPAVVIAVIAACVFVHLARVYALFEGVGLAADAPSPWAA